MIKTVKTTLHTESSTYQPVRQTSWLAPFFGAGLFAAGGWVKGCYQQAKEAVQYTFNVPEDFFFIKVQENEHFSRLQAWRHELEQKLRELKSAVLTGELNAVELGERLLAIQRPEQIAEHIYSPVIYSSILAQLEQDLRKQDEKKNTACMNPRELILAANIIDKVLQQLRADLRANPDLSEEYFCSDLINAVILYSSDQTSRDELLHVVYYYGSLIDDILWRPLVGLIQALPENITDPNNPFDFAQSNQQIRTILRNIQSVFDDYHANLTPIDDVANYATNKSRPDTVGLSYFQRCSTLLETGFETVKGLTRQGIRLVRENPRKAITCAASTAALGYLHYSSGHDGSNPPFNLNSIALYPTWANFQAFSEQVNGHAISFAWEGLTHVTSQTTRMLLDAMAVYSLGFLSGHSELILPSVAITSLVSLWIGAQAADPIIVNPIPDQTAKVGELFSHIFHWNNIFSDLDNDTLSITAILSDGSLLPSWLKLKMFDYSFIAGAYDTPWSARGITAVNNTVFLADGFGGLIIFDVSDPCNPHLLFQYGTPGVVRDIVIKDRIAYLADGFEGLHIVNIDNLTAPVYLGSYDTPSNVYEIAIQDDIAYLAVGSYDIVILDIANFSAPIVLSNYSTPGFFRHAIHVQNDIAYVADGNSLEIIDVRDPSLPASLGNCLIPGNARGVAVYNNIAYVASENEGLKLVDVSNSSNPHIIGSYNTPGKALKVVVSNAKAYVADGTSGVHIIDVTNPYAPFSLGRYYTPDQATDVAVTGDLICVADDFSGLQIIDTSAYPIGNYPVGVDSLFVGSYGVAGELHGLALKDTIAYAGFGNVIVILDVTNPALPTPLGLHNTLGDLVRDIEIFGNLAYVANRNSGLQIVNVTASTMPFSINTYSTLGWAVEVALSSSGNTAYVACQRAGLLLLDVSNPQTVVLLSNYSTPSSTEAVKVVGNLAYVIDDTNGLFILNVSNTNTPSLLGHYNTPDYAYGLFIQNEIAYVVARREGLWIINVTDPLAPTLFSSYRSPDFADDVFVAGNTAWVAAHGSGILIFDVSDPRSPMFLGEYNTPGTAYRVVVQNDLAYIADGSSLQIVNITRRTFYGTPANTGLYTVNVTADDGHGGSVTDQFQIRVDNITALSSSQLSSSPSTTSTRSLTVISSSRQASITSTLSARYSHSSLITTSMASLTPQGTFSNTRSTQFFRQSNVSVTTLASLVNRGTTTNSQPPPSYYSSSSAAIEQTYPISFSATSSHSTPYSVNTRLQQATTERTTSEGNGLNLVFIIAITLGPLCGLGLITLPVVYLLYRRKTHRDVASNSVVQLDHLEPKQQETEPQRPNPYTFFPDETRGSDAEYANIPPNLDTHTGLVYANLPFRNAGVMRMEDEQYANLPTAYY